MKNSKKNTIKIRESFINCSHIWHVDIPKCIYQSDTQSVEVWCINNTSDMKAPHLCKKLPKKCNKVKFHNLYVLISDTSIH